MNDRPVMWVNGQGLQLQVQSPAGPLYLQELYMVALMARAYGGEVIRFTYDWTDPEDGHTVSGAGRIVYEELPDPRAQTTEEQSTEQPASPAGATPDACKKCGRTFVDDGKFVDSAARYSDFPYCHTCVDRCHDSEIADHWCEIDQYRHEQRRTEQLPDADADPEIERKRIVPIGSPFPGFPSEAESADRIFGPGTAESLGTAARYIERPSGPPVRVDVPCLGEECTGCSDPQCWTARADGGDA